MSLTTVLEKIKKLEVHANENVEEGPIQTLNARRGRQRQATEELRYAKEEYIKEMHKNSVFIIAIGSSNQEFADMAKNEFFSFSVDPDTIYNELAAKIPELIYKGKSGNTGLFDILGRHIEDKANDLNLAEYNYVIYKQTYAQPLNTREDLSKLIKKAVNEQIGAEIVGIHALRHISKEALKRSHDSKTTAVVLPTNDEAFALDLAKTLKKISKKVHVVVVGKSSKSAKSIAGATILKEVNHESVMECLKSLNKGK